MIQNALDDILRSVILIFLVIGIGAGIYYSNLKIQEYFFPVLSKASFSYSALESKKYGYTHLVDLRFYKERACYPLINDFAWYIKNNKGYERVSFEIPKDKGGISRPTGWNYSPNWKVDLRDNNLDVEQKVIFKHSCFFSKITTTILIKNNRVISINGHSS